MRDTVLWRKEARIIILLKETLDISAERALDIFYSTRVYQYMCNLQFHLHNMSDAYCADEVMLEIENA